jgi:hypothetical protein
MISALHGKFIPAIGRHWTLKRLASHIGRSFLGFEVVGPRTTDHHLQPTARHQGLVALGGQGLQRAAAEGGARRPPPTETRHATGKVVPTTSWWADAGSGTRAEFNTAAADRAKTPIYCPNAIHHVHVVAQGRRGSCGADH